MKRTSIKSLGALIILGCGALGLGTWMAPGIELEDLFPSGAIVESGSPPLTEEIDTEAVAGAGTQLDALIVEGSNSVDGYDRDAFGQRWADIDRNGCDQRNDALRAAAVEMTIKPGTHGCVVLEATIEDPYTGTTIDFIKGENTVDIDHVVPLSRAWQQGAANWSEDQREEFANTAENLLAVDASANRSKGDSGPEEWMPEAGRCGYTVQWISVKTQFELTVTPAEKSALETELTDCEGSGN